MSNEVKEVPPGRFVAFSTGCYSDYEVCIFVKTLKTINAAAWDAMRDVCVVPWSDGSGKTRTDNGRAIPWLIANGYVEEIEYQELHIGDYGDLDPWEDA